MTMCCGGGLGTATLIQRVVDVVSARLDHHVALRTGDIDAAIRFWTSALEGVVATPPALRSGGYFDQLFGQGAQVKISYVTFEAGAIELFEFVEPRVDVPRSSQTGRRRDALRRHGARRAGCARPGRGGRRQAAPARSTASAAGR